MSDFLAACSAAFHSWLEGQRALRDAARTRRFLASLPDDIRKDIGWPDGRTAQAPSRPAEPEGYAEAFLARGECSIG